MSNSKPSPSRSLRRILILLGAVLIAQVIVLVSSQLGWVREAPMHGTYPPRPRRATGDLPFGPPSIVVR